MGHKSASKGFTLIELAIVLVVIGLLVGGVVVGRDMIRSAQLRATIQQVDMLKASHMAFLLKYNCMPGDCQNGSAFGFTPALVTLSDAGNTESWFDRVTPVSSANAFMLFEVAVQPYMYFVSPTLSTYQPAATQNLLISPDGNGDLQYGLEEGIAGNITLDQAKLAKADTVRGGIPIKADASSPINNAHAFLLPLFVSPVSGSIASVGGNYLVITSTAIPNHGAAAALTTDQALYLDSKMDDGKPLSGAVLTTSNSLFPMTPSDGLKYDAAQDGGSTRCLMDGSGTKAQALAGTTYNLKSPAKGVAGLCAMMIKI